MQVIKKVVNANYYGHCNVWLSNVSNHCPVWIVHREKKVFEQVASSPGGGKWQNACVDVPIMPGTTEICVKTNYLYWHGRNYTSTSVQPKVLCQLARVLSYSDAENSGYVRINRNVLSCGKKGVLVLCIKDKTIWGGSPYYNSCAATYAKECITIVTPKTVKIYFVSGNRLYPFNELRRYLDLSRSYFILCEETPKIVRNETYLAINGKKCPPGKYDVYAGTKIPFKITLTKPATVQIYDKQSDKVLWSGSGKIVTGNLTVNKSCQIEFRVECGGKIVDRYG